MFFFNTYMFINELLQNVFITLVGVKKTDAIEENFKNSSNRYYNSCIDQSVQRRYY